MIVEVNEDAGEEVEMRQGGKWKRRKWLWSRRRTWMRRRRRSTGEVEEEEVEEVVVAKKEDLG